jgi:hypothetical protein
VYDKASGGQGATDEHLLGRTFRSGAVSELIAEGAPDTDVHLDQIIVLALS